MITSVVLIYILFIGLPPDILVGLPPDILVRSSPSTSNCIERESESERERERERERESERLNEENVSASGLVFCSISGDPVRE